jgi:hypothetical protein
MIHAHIDKEKAVPMWAALGVPLIGIPLMVALLALTAPVGTAPTAEPEATVQVEQVDVQSVDHTVDVTLDDKEYLLRGV